MLKSEE